MLLISFGLVVSCVKFVRLRGQESSQQFAPLQRGHSRDIVGYSRDILRTVGMGIIQAISKASNLVT